MNIRPVHLAAILIVAVSIILAWSAAGSSINPYITASQAGSPAYESREVQVLAILDDWSVRDDGALELGISDVNARLNVTYRGIPPQGLTRGQKIVAIGIMHPPDRLEASRLLVKCPSKYEAGT